MAATPQPPNPAPLPGGPGLNASHGAGGAVVSLPAFLRGSGLEALWRHEALDGVEVPREAQLACHCAWARILSRSCSSRGLLSLGRRRGPSTWGGLSFQGPGGDGQDSWPPEEPERRPDDTELSPSSASSPSGRAGWLRAFPREPGCSV